MPRHALPLLRGRLAVLGAAALSVSLATISLRAQERARPKTPTSFDQLSVLAAPGDRVTVTDSSGSQFRATIAALSPSTLSVRVGRELRQLREADVMLIRQRRDDTLRNGALWGLGSGATVAMTACGHCHLGPGLMMAGLWGGLGAGIGVGVDAIIRGQTTVFERPGASGTKVIVAPRLSPSHQGVMVSVKF